jgi:lincosamide nucleotidyltransferase A/C/D/E
VDVTAEDASKLYELLRRANIRCWVMGGWGVDALVGSQTRAHHDLDVLVLADDLRSLRQLFDERGFAIMHVWEAENRPLDVDGDTWPTAFVAADNDGIELDVHVVGLRNGVVVPLCNVPWRFDPGGLDGRGMISGRPIACLAARTQLVMHDGYELPEAHKRDLELLRDLT